MNIQDFKIGDNVKFQYVNRQTNYGTFPQLTEYAVDDVAGRIVSVRDMAVNGIQDGQPAIDRSRYLLVIKTQAGPIKSYYHGRMINTRKTNKSFVGRIISKIAK